MTSKTQLTEAVAKRLGRTVSGTRPTVDAVFDEIASSLAKGIDVRISGFGTFAVKEMKARGGVNPRTGEKFAIPARAKLTFKPVPELKGKL